MHNRADEIRMMHDNGMTYAAIGQSFGVSPQAVHQMANSGFGDGLHESTIRKIKYLGLRKWMLTNRVCIRDLEKLCGGTSRFHACLIGASNPGKKTIDAILDATGLTYEECFKEEENKV